MFVLTGCPEGLRSSLDDFFTAAAKCCDLNLLPSGCWPLGWMTKYLSLVFFRASSSVSPGLLEVRRASVCMMGGILCCSWPNSKILKTLGWEKTVLFLQIIKHEYFLQTYSSLRGLLWGQIFPINPDISLFQISHSDINFMSTINMIWHPRWSGQLGATFRIKISGMFVMHLSWSAYSKG